MSDGQVRFQWNNFNLTLRKNYGSDKADDLICADEPWASSGGLVVSSPSEWHCTTRHGTARLKRHGTARHHTTRHVTSRHVTSLHHTARHGMTRYDTTIAFRDYFSFTFVVCIYGWKLQEETNPFTKMLSLRVSLAYFWDILDCPILFKAGTKIVFLHKSCPLSRALG